MVARLIGGWRVTVGGRAAYGTTLVDAFEALLNRPAGDREMAVVVEALERNATFADETA